MANLTTLSKQNSERFRVAKLSRGPEFAPVARRLVADKTYFQGRPLRINNSEQAILEFVAYAAAGFRAPPASKRSSARQ